MRILIAGATGSIGRHLVRRLVEQGNSCRCLVRKYSKIDELRKLDVELWYGELTDRDSLKGISHGIDVVYNLAVVGGVSAVSKDAFRKMYDVNVAGVQNLIEECLKSPVKKFIHFSSTAAMGLYENRVVDERVPCMPVTPYQKSKYESEQIVLEYYRNFNFPAVILRPCMVYGEGCNGEYIKIFKYIKKGFFPRLGFGSKMTPVIYIEHLINAALKAANRGIDGQVYILVDKSIGMDSLRKKILLCLGVKRLYFYVPQFVVFAIVKIYEMVAILSKIEPKVTSYNLKSTIADRIFDTSKSRKELSYKQNIGIDESLERTICWARSQKLL